MEMDVILQPDGQIENLRQKEGQIGRIIIHTVLISPEAQHSSDTVLASCDLVTSESSNTVGKMFNLRIKFIRGIFGQGCGGNPSNATPIKLSTRPENSFSEINKERLCLYSFLYKLILQDALETLCLSISLCPGGWEFDHYVFKFRQVTSALFQDMSSGSSVEKDQHGVRSSSVTFLLYGVSCVTIAFLDSPKWYNFSRRPKTQCSVSSARKGAKEQEEAPQSEYRCPFKNNPRVRNSRSLCQHVERALVLSAPKC
ncbi:hypothetical protein RRG08_028021 [Elysia crispata]|uniref:Uncharacterized protein n=1 Tax=Elysia crispata TaxID=231223 RepID=A0AAE1EDU8_9GAST|nr:hypothetical protein RRG08_028021 [Elysia crispata]